MKKKKIRKDQNSTPSKAFPSRTCLSREFGAFRKSFKGQLNSCYHTAVMTFLKIMLEVWKIIPHLVQWIIAIILILKYFLRENVQIIHGNYLFLQYFCGIAACTWDASRRPKNTFDSNFGTFLGSHFSDFRTIRNAATNVVNSNNLQQGLCISLQSHWFSELLTTQEYRNKRHPIEWDTLRSQIWRG